MRFTLIIKVALLVLFAAVVPSTVIVTYSTNSYEQSAKSQTFEFLASVSEEVANRYFDLSDRNGRLVFSVAASLQEVQPYEWLARLNNIARSEPEVLLLAVSDSSGMIVAVSNPERWGNTWAANGSNVSGKAFFRDIIAGTEYRFSESTDSKAYYTLPFDDPISSSAKPLVQVYGKSFTGIDGKRYALIIVFDWYNLAQEKMLVLMDSLFGKIGSNIFSPNASGNMIWADTNSPRVGTFLQSSAFGSAWSFYQAVSSIRPESLSKVNASTSEYTLSGQGRMVAVCMAPSWFPYSLGFFAYLTNPEVIYSYLSTSRNTSILIAGVAAAAAVFLSSVVVHSITRKISRVVEEAKLVASGDLRSRQSKEVKKN